MAFQSSFTPVEPFNAIDGVVLRSTELDLLYNLNISSLATITGIIVNWTGGTTGWDQTTEVMTVGFEGSDNSEILSSNEPTTPYSGIGTVSFGGTSNLWGLTWTPFNVNRIFTKFSLEGIDNATAYHDAFQVKIYYTLPPSGTIIMDKGSIKITQGKITL